MHNYYKFIAFLLAKLKLYNIFPDLSQVNLVRF